MTEQDTLHSLPVICVGVYVHAHTHTHTFLFKKLCNGIMWFADRSVKLEIYVLIPQNHFETKII